VVDKTSGKYLGVITISSDLSRLSPRDDFIGWSKDNMWKDKKIGSSSVAQTIVPVQPFGYNVLGGKLCAIMCGDKQIRTDWKTRYKQELVGMTTMSLYGSYSMYQNIPCWKKVGKTQGTIIIKPDDEYYFKWVEWLKKYHTKHYQQTTKNIKGTKLPPTSVKQKVINMIFRKLKINLKKYQNEQTKGVYYMSMYSNTKDYLQNSITKKDLILDKKLDKEFLLDWWRERAIRRYTTLHEKQKLNDKVLWYSQLDERKVKNWFYARGIHYV
jgi:hypothetical protein